MASIAIASSFRKVEALTIYYNTNVVRVVIVGVKLPDVFLLDLECSIA